MEFDSVGRFLAWVSGETVARDSVEGTDPARVRDAGLHPGQPASVFDHHCASVYVAQRTDVAFRPMGLDLFDKLPNGCEAVRNALEKERNALESQKVQFPDVAEGTAVHDLIIHLTSLTDPESVKNLACLTEAEKTPFNIDGKYGYISSMYTKEGHRRRGLAKQLLQVMLEYAKETGLRCVKLHASEIGEPLYSSNSRLRLFEPPLNPFGVREFGERYPPTAKALKARRNQSSS